jgi:hypothetical protein
VRGGPEHEAFAAHTTARGHVLARRLLGPDVRGRGVGRSAAFGYDLGGILHAACGTGYGRRREVAELCGIFNVGIVVFDRLSDRDPVGLARALAATDVRGLRTELPEAESPELRALLAIVRSFFSGVRRLSSDWSRLATLLEDTYRAQLRSAGPLADGEAAAIAATKSRAPFEIMLEVARHCDPDVGRVDTSEAATLTARVAEVFALADDLADLEEDQATGSLNSILASSGREPGIDVVDEATETLAVAVVDAVALLERSGAAGAGRSRELVLGYLWSWLRPQRAPRMATAAAFVFRSSGDVIGKNDDGNRSTPDFASIVRPPNE